MIIRKSLLKLRRTPVRTMLFFLLVAFAAALLSTGGGLWQMCRENMARFEGMFQTIATVEQKPERYVRKEVWTADRGEYEVVNRAEYGDMIPLSVLSFEGADYISGPERRGWYAAWLPDYEMMDAGSGVTSHMVVEASPVEDAVPAGPIKMEIKNILYTYYPYNAPNFYYCDHFNPSPDMLYADKTYLMWIYDGLPHGWPEVWDPPEYLSMEAIVSAQTGPEGAVLPNDLSGSSIAEVTPGFYETEEGQRWLALVRELEMGIWHSAPVTVTDNLDLIPIFYDGSVSIIEGREFTEEDYSQGRRVCLISRKFAKRNDLKAGDVLHLPLRYGDYREPSSQANWSSRLTAEGKNFPVFEEADWEICGIYDMLPGGFAKSSDYRLDDNEIIIPRASIKNDDSENIADWGPMKGWNTSFEIPNGTIEHWKKLWEQQGIEGLEITFYDKGYSVLEDGINRMKKMAFILLAAGGVSVLSVMLFFCHMFITKQGVATAVERSLGMTKRQCAGLLMSGILLLALCGCILGSVGGYFCAEKTAEKLTQVERFDRNFSAGMMYGQEEEGTTYLLEGSWRVCAVTGAVVIGLTVGIASVMIHGSLRKEPLALLSGREE